MKVVNAKIDSVIPYARNPRKNQQAVSKVAASIKEFGWQQPIVVDADNVVIAGHTRLMAAQQMGLESVPVVVASDLTPEQVKAYRLADNRVSEEAEWDTELLALELDELKELEYDLDLTGFDAKEIAALTAKTTEGITDPDDVPEPPKQPVTVRGDLWTLGRHRLMCGDSTSIEAVESLVAGGGCDLLLTDPPYNVGYVGKTKASLTIQNDSMADSDFRQFLRDAFTAADAVMKPGAVFYIWHADSQGYNFRGACHDAGWEVRQCLIWNKDVMVMGRQDYHWKHEPCLYGWKGGAGHLWASDRKQTTILSFDRPSRSKSHPTMKPVALFEYQILNNTKGQDIVLDLFGGSGTTIIAAETHGRHARVMELDPKYCDVIINRWQDFTGQQATLNGKTYAEVKGERQAKKAA